MSRARIVPLLCLALAGSAVAACDGDDDYKANVTPDGSIINNPDGSVDPDGGVASTFPAFVKNLILNETKENNAPVSLESAPAQDSEQADIFDPAFFR
jgi:hypothetical protein